MERDYGYAHLSITASTYAGGEEKSRPGHDIIGRLG